MKAHNALSWHLKQLANKGKGHVARAYKDLTNDVDRRQFALRLKVDPDGAFCKVSETYAGSSRNTLGRVRDWHALWEVAFLEY